MPLVAVAVRAGLFGAVLGGVVGRRKGNRDGVKPSTRGRSKYAPYAAQKRAELRGRRPKASKFEHAELAAVMQAKLCTKWSPEQISDHLATTFPDPVEMQVCPETIY